MTRGESRVFVVMNHKVTEGTYICERYDRWGEGNGGGVGAAP